MTHSKHDQNGHDCKERLPTQPNHDRAEADWTLRRTNVLVWQNSLQSSRFKYQDSVTNSGTNHCYRYFNQSWQTVPSIRTYTCCHP